MEFRLRTTQKTGADLNGARPKEQRRRDASRIGDATSRYHWHFHCIHHGRYKSEESDHARLGLGGIEASTVPACLHALRYDDIGTRFLRGTSLGHSRDVRPPRDASLLQASNEIRWV
jgi:hypothetical protein